MRRRSRGHSDAAWWSSGPPEHRPTQRYEGSVRTAQYLEMPDGTRIAIDLFLPQGLGEDERIPTLLTITPYFRAMEFRWSGFEKLIRKLIPLGAAEAADELARYGYASVLMDIRGAGASYGRKSSMMMPDVVGDGAAVVDWIVGQPWSNGLVGSHGISGLGMTGQWLLTAKHPAVKAIAPRFTVFDIFAATHPGGLSASRFVQDIGAMLRAMDSNRLHEMPENRLARWLLRLMVKGLRPVDEDPDRTLLAEAVREHADNEAFDQDIVAVTHRDDVLPGSSIPATIDTQSPFSHAADMAASDAAIYGFTGWHDGAFIREMISLHLTVRTPGSRLIIGPWGHGGRWYSSPLIAGRRPTDFDHVAEMVRFFDCHLREIDPGVVEEPPIHYFTMGEEKWKETETWPPPEAETVRFHLGPGHTLRADGPGHEEASDPYRVDFTAGTGVHSRFGKHLAGGRFPVRYPKRKRRDKKLLTYTSPPLEQELEVTGHPMVTLFVSSNASDGAFIVYLEDVSPDGRVMTVTDGYLRASNRKVSSAAAPYWLPGPYRTYTSADVIPLVPDEVTELVFDLYPVSYLFKASHSIRVALAGADKDNIVRVPTGETPAVRIHRGGTVASRIDLPRISRSRADVSA